MQLPSLDMIIVPHQLNLELSVQLADWAGLPHSKLLKFI